MKTSHIVNFGDSRDMSMLESESVNLAVTSPPYPMIRMWDEIMSNQSHKVKKFLSEENGSEAFEEMHKELDKVWAECFRVLKKGSFLCVNIGDASRTIGGKFQLFSNHSRIISACSKAGFECLPSVIWRKRTNAPNKFMGSGMLPCGAYVTLEHEWILVFRKGGKRAYREDEEKKNRMKSAFFWEERNSWFSDIWDVAGTSQKMKSSEGRERSAAYPMEIPFRIVEMYSQKGDMVLDPFAGIGTTSLASAMTGRNSIGYDIDESLKNEIESRFSVFGKDFMNSEIDKRMLRHVKFAEERERGGKDMKYFNEVMKCKVMTRQETGIELCKVSRFEKTRDDDRLEYECEYY